MSAVSAYWDAVEARPARRKPKARKPARRPSAPAQRPASGEQDLTVDEVAQAVLRLVTAVRDAVREATPLPLRRWPCIVCHRDRCMAWEARCIRCQP